MFVVIVGGGRTGTQLATLLLAQNHDVRVVESRSEILARIHRELPTETIYEGNTTDPNVLEQAGIKTADVVAAVTNNDADNLAICFLARSRYKVGRTIARVNNPRSAWLFDQKFHVDVALNAAEILSGLIEEEMSLGDMMTLLKLRRGNYAIVEQKVPAGAKGLGIALKDLALPEQCIIAAIVRQGEIVLPRGITAFEVGDEVLAVTDSQGAQQLAELLSAPGNGGSKRPA
ncbi:potassium channel family protein [Candidatus Amarolinea aalborgensis]|jgi:trk system potassium uptake protein TrkA|uniref:potassium channel family protein n=1 Tax=Candidatus Amarolinea aalborgensis TaxID=2249329 RepID=UPI003BF9BB0A